jgi:hypothetical protein
VLAQDGIGLGSEIDEEFGEERIAGGEIFGGQDYDV